MLYFFMKSTIVCINFACLTWIAFELTSSIVFVDYVKTQYPFRGSFYMTWSDFTCMFMWTTMIAKFVSVIISLVLLVLANVLRDVTAKSWKFNCTFYLVSVLLLNTLGIFMFIMWLAMAILSPWTLQGNLILPVM